MGLATVQSHVCTLPPEDVAPLRHCLQLSSAATLYQLTAQAAKWWGVIRGEQCQLRLARMRTPSLVPDAQQMGITLHAEPPRHAPVHSPSGVGLA